MRVSDPTETFRQMMMEARVGRAVKAERSLAEISEKIERSEARWTEEELRETVARVLADSIREAGKTDRQALARSIAPHILTTIRSEIGNAHPEIIEALSPRLGELIRAAVAKSMEDLQRQIDQAVPVDIWIANFKAKLTGTPPTGWLLDGKDGFAVIEAYLIERGSGLLLARDRPNDTPADVTELDDDLMSGMIAALDAFARDAFGGGGVETLRQLTLSAGTIYLRASPTKILALRCTGVATPEVEVEINELLDRVIQRMQDGQDDADLAPARLLADAPQTEDDSVSAAALVGKGIGAIAAVIALLWGHFALEAMNNDRWTTAIEASVHEDAGLSGYPVAVAYDGSADTVRIEGLVPDEAARAGIEARLSRLSVPLNYSLTMPVAGRRIVE